MIRITYINVVNGKAYTKTFISHERAVDTWNDITRPGYAFCATMTSDTGKLMRSYASGSFDRARDTSTWATR